MKSVGELQEWNCAPAKDATVDTEEMQRLARARAGDEAAIGWLIARYRQRVVRLAAHILRRPDEAEDVAQEAFIRAFRHLRGYRGEGQFYTWLYHIVVNVCRDRQRSRQWNVEEPIDDAALCADLTPLATEGVEARVLVEMLMDRLSPPMRAMLVLRELDGLEYEEIARVLEIPVGRVRWRLHEARARFRDIWSAAMEEVNHV